MTSILTLFSKWLLKIANRQKKARRLFQEKATLKSSMERSSGGSNCAYAARAAASYAGAAGDHRGRSRDRDPSSSDSSFSGSRSSANVNTSRMKATHPQQVRHVDPAYVTTTTRCHADKLHTCLNNNNAQLEPREREIMMQLLVQITDFVARKQQLSKRHRGATSNGNVGSNTTDWRKDFRRSRYDERPGEQRSDSKDLFEVVIHICEDRMQQLSDDEVQWCFAYNQHRRAYYNNGLLCVYMPVL